MSKSQLLAILATLLTISNAIAAPKPAIQHIPTFITSTRSNSVAQPTSNIHQPRNDLESANTATQLPCYNFADPDNGVGNECMCSNGQILPTAPSTGTNTGTNYNPCPYTTVPPASTTTRGHRPRFTGLANATATGTMPTASSLPCYNFADPDDGIGNYCMCSNGISTAVASATGNNTGIYYQPCPYTVAPTSQETPVPTEGQTTEETPAPTSKCVSTEETPVPRQHGPTKKNLYSKSTEESPDSTEYGYYGSADSAYYSEALSTDIYHGDDRPYRIPYIPHESDDYIDSEDSSKGMTSPHPALIYYR